MNAPHGVLNSLEAASGSSLTDDGYKICSRGAIKRLHSITSIFRLLRKNFNCCHMKHEVETDRHSNPQDTLDAGSTHEGGGFEQFEEFEKFEGLLPSGRASGARSERFESPEGGQAGASDPSNSSNSSNSSNPSAELEERVRADCRRTCRRNFWIELFKSAAKIAGVVLAALGLSSFNEEN